MRSSSKTPPPKQLAFDFNLPSQPSVKPEPLLTIAEASPVFNLKPHVLRRAIKIGAIPVYRIGNGRMRLLGSDIARAIEASRTAGQK